MTTQHSPAARIVRHYSALSILIPRRNVRGYRADTRHLVRMHIGAVRILRTMGA